MDINVILARLHRHGWTVTSTECWEWAGPRHEQGYGRIKIVGVSQLTHRLAYLVWVGPIPEGLVVRHSCDNPPCINPKHLLLGTQKDNVHDSLLRNRHVALSGYEHYAAILSDKDVAHIKMLYHTGKWTRRKLAREYNVSKSSITRILNDKRWRKDR